MLGYFDGAGIRFQYPPDWALDVSSDETLTVIELTSSANCFAVVRIDEGRPDPKSQVDEVVDALRDDYPTLEAQAVKSNLAGHEANGQDIEFFSLDMAVEAAVRSARTSRRTITVFAQWSDDEEQPEAAFRQIVKTLEEMDEADEDEDDE